MLILDSHIEGAQLYSPKQRGEIYRAIIEYGYYDMEPDWLKGEALGFFIAIKPTSIWLHILTRSISSELESRLNGYCTVSYKPESAALRAISKECDVIPIWRIFP